jgi:hypothetical protein
MAVELLKRTSDRRTVNLASYHSRHSLTWSWILSATADGAWRKPCGGLRIGVHPYRTNGGLQVVVTLPGLVFHWHRQRPIWYRDLYRRARDREHEREWAEWQAVVEPLRPSSLASTPHQGGLQ